MTELLKLEKRIVTIEKLKKEGGFLRSFFSQFRRMSSELSLQWQQWKSITRPSEHYRWEIGDEGLGFLLDIDMESHLYYNVTLQRFQCFTGEEPFPVEKRELCQAIMDDGFDAFFIRHYCLPVTMETLPAFLKITKEDYKASWICDRSRQMIYFKFRNLCGEGAVKKTYFGWNVTLHQPIVVYQIQVSPNVMEQKRYANEKRIAEVKRSPFLLSVHHYFTLRDQNKVFMIADFMKYSLKTMMDIRYPWSREELQRFSLHIVTALHILHQMKIIHRDVKPSNILYDDEEHRYCLIDFGVATKYSTMAHRVETLNLHSENLSLVGTVGYISPEMYTSIYTLSHESSYSFTVDIFSFGLTLLEMVVNQRAFLEDLSHLSEIIQEDVDTQSLLFPQMIEKETTFLQEVCVQLQDSSVKKKKDHKLEQEIHTKIELLGQLLMCECEEKESYISELLEKNRWISRYCQRFKSDPLLHTLEQRTSEGHTFLSEMQNLEKFASKLESFRKKPVEEMVDDVSVYPILFHSPRYTYPLSLRDVKDPLLKDFLEKCLHKHPMCRWNTDQLLNHPWITENKNILSIK